MLVVPLPGLPRLLPGDRVLRSGLCRTRYSTAPNRCDRAAGHVGPCGGNLLVGRVVSSGRKVLRVLWQDGTGNRLPQHTAAVERIPFDEAAKLTGGTF